MTEILTIAVMDVHLQQDIEMKYQFKKIHRSEFTMKKMYQVLKISMSGFYRWINRPLSARAKQNGRLKERIFEFFSEHNGMGGLLIHSDRGVQYTSQNFKNAL